MVFGLGYDHQNYISTSGEFEYRNYASEMVFGRGGFRVIPDLTLGVEGTGAFTKYEQRILNDNSAYSGGIYGDWRPGSCLSIQPRLGYTIYDFQQTSLLTKAQGLDTWYAGLTVRHDITEAISYSLSAGHEVRLGIESDWIEDWHVRPSVTFGIFKDLVFKTYFSYEHGKPGGVPAGGIGGSLEDRYDWYGGGLSLAYPVTKDVTVSLSYRLTLRRSDAASREYTQSLVGLLLTYTPK